MHAQMPHMADVGGFQGYIYVHPNAIAGDLMTPNAYANATHMREVLDPTLDKMAVFPGMNAKTLVKYPPFQRPAINVSDVIGKMSKAATSPDAAAWLGKLGMPKSSVEAIQAMIGKFAKEPTAAAPPAIERNAQPSAPIGIQAPARRLVRRHGPGDEMRVSPGRMDMDSRLLGDRDLKSPKMAEALEKAMPFGLMDGQIRVHLVAGPKVWAQGKDDTSIHPAWRKTYAHSIATGAGTPNAQALRDLAPDMGAYVNEVC
jgi:hypothetical protein